jgi:L,D-peptidoglycan transpeptidase YkuD (ErfK/YbiS/YcfS/YnhG family)
MFLTGNTMPIHRPALRTVSCLLSIAAMLLIAGCAHRPAGDAQAARWQHARQLVLVTTADWNADHGTLRSFSRGDDGDWHMVGAPFPVVIGRTGAAWGIGLHDVPPDSDGPVKQEGDGRSPAGVFTIGEAFGYAQAVGTALPYVAMQASDYCIDVSDSPLYNRIVDANDVGTDAVKDSTEPMRRDLHADGDQRYREGFVIEHNPLGKPGAGSCIFAHLWKSPDSTTAGCTAMDPAAMRSLLAWLDAGQRPVFVLLPQSEYDRLHAAWQLPSLEP